MFRVKVCPKCGSTAVREVLDEEKKRFVNKCLKCGFKGDALFKDIDPKLAS